MYLILLKINLKKREKKQVNDYYHLSMSNNNITGGHFENSGHFEFFHAMSYSGQVLYLLSWSNNHHLPPNEQNTRIKK